VKEGEDNLPCQRCLGRGRRLGPRARCHVESALISRAVLLRTTQSAHQSASLHLPSTDLQPRPHNLGFRLRQRRFQHTLGSVQISQILPSTGSCLKTFLCPSLRSWESVVNAWPVGGTNWRGSFYHRECDFELGFVMRNRRKAEREKGSLSATRAGMPRDEEEEGGGGRRGEGKSSCRTFATIDAAESIHKKKEKGSGDRWSRRDRSLVYESRNR
jgi:hypothetical protein